MEPDPARRGKLGRQWVAGTGGHPGGSNRVRQGAAGPGGTGRRRRGCCCLGRWRGKCWRGQRCCRPSRSGVWGRGSGCRRWAPSPCSTWGAGGVRRCGPAARQAASMLPPCGQEGCSWRQTLPLATCPKVRASREKGGQGVREAEHPMGAGCSLPTGLAPASSPWD